MIPGFVFCVTFVMHLLLNHKAIMVSPQPPGGGGGSSSGVPSFDRPTGESDSTSCPKTSGTCSKTGSDGYASWNVVYDTSTGIFTGNLITSKCPSTTITTSSDVDCTKQTIPDPTFATTPKIYPLLGTIGYSLRGSLIYSPFENGFTDGQACSGGTCDAGMDLATCEAKLLQSCTNHKITRPEVLLDDCSGHANPYHIHKDLVCEYDETVTTSHSPLVGVMLDGRGLYGMYEDSNGKPTDLDECGGHYGPVPSAKLDSDTNATAASNVYHYHTQDVFPYTTGCYGPVSSKAISCEQLNVQACGLKANSTQYDVLVDGIKRTIYYKKWCPCTSSNPAALVVTGGLNFGTAPTSSPTLSTTPTKAPTTTSPTTTTIPTATPSSPTSKSPTATKDTPSKGNSLSQSIFSYKTVIAITMIVFSTITTFSA